MKKNKGGRPSKFKKEYIKQAAMAGRAGFTDLDVAELLGVTESTIYEWKEKHPEFSEALKTGKANKDDEVENSLLKRALGYTRQIERPSKDGPVMCSEEMPPDVTACIFWLKNRRPKEWREKQEHEHSGTLNLTAVIQDA